MLLKAEVLYCRFDCSMDEEIEALVLGACVGVAQRTDSS